MPLYVADYVADTPYLTTEQHGAYLLLLMAYWRNGPPPDNDAILSSLVKMTPDAWSIARAVLVHYFDVCDGFWIHKRVEKEIEVAKRNRSTAHDKAANAAKVRWERERERKMLEALHKNIPEQCPSPSPSSSPIQALQDKSAAPPVAGAPPPKKRSTGKSQAKSLDDWLTECEAKGEKPIPDDDPIREWADNAGIPHDYMRLAWLVFVSRWQSKKPQKDWRATFRNAIRDNWLKLWYVHPVDGDCRLTTSGEQERRANG